VRLPYMNPGGGKTKRQMVRFGGVNYSQDAREGELEDSWGLSSSQFPCLSQRRGRKTAAAYESPTALYARGKLCVVEGDKLLYDGKEVGKVSPGEKQFATINTKIVLFPDRVYYDTLTGAMHPLGGWYSIHPGDLSFTSDSLSVPEQSYFDEIAQEGALMEGVEDAQTIPTFTAASVNRKTGVLTLTPGEEKYPQDLEPGDIIQQGFDEAREYLIVEKAQEQDDGSYQIRGMLRQVSLCEYPGFDEQFKVGDAVTLSGCDSCEGNNGSHIIRGMDGRTLSFDKDIFQATGVETAQVSLERKVPELTCICECDNRIWGAEGSTIYASALGDPTNFFVYEGLSTDSYAATVGTQGEFTACCAYSSTVLFWKEDCVHKILGSYPAQYEIYTYQVPGVQKGAEKSLCILNETLFYKGRAGVYAYAGGSPELLTECFGTRRFSGGAAGTDGERYYISMQTEQGDWKLYVLDVARGIWLREDDTHAVDWAYLDGALYYLDGSTGKVVSTGQDREEEGKAEWRATFCPFHETVHGRKGYSRLYLRVELETGAWIKAEVSADGAPFRQVYLGHDDHAKTVQIPILSTRCDSFRVRLSGRGECVLKSFVREFSIGSEY